ncbi:MAG: hypothetical protein JSV99_09915 [Planctomycetota bacterium]|nr:MAG: hypothetical protein JSV99_09915 [Planctomycetota bacterium]
MSTEHFLLGLFGVLCFFVTIIVVVYMGKSVNMERRAGRAKVDIGSSGELDETDDCGRKSVV